jgi:hypothetical protein
MTPNFVRAAWCGGGFQRVRCVESLILVDALFPLDGGRRREGKKRTEKKKKITMVKEGFPGAGPT